MRPATIRQLEQRRDLAVSDLLALEAQLEAGDLDAAHAERLRRSYQADIADAIAALEAHRAEKPAGRSPARVWSGVAVFATLAALSVFALTQAVEPRDEAGQLSGVVADVVDRGGVDLSAVTDDELEAVVAANPEVIPMRLALARRYFEAGNFTSALPHYLAVLEQGPDTEALMYVGWMTYLSGDADTGESLLERSLEVEPQNVMAAWLLANLRYNALGDTAGALPLLRQVIDSGTAPADIVEEARTMIEQAGGGS